mmetsp:Transcript_136145/g.254415  ORF Transcript_136145/g.254415 Transcript_136145/m.254415 type:complete len:235 (+) Transcript_136145:321-1025(+)
MCLIIKLISGCSNSSILTLSMHFITANFTVSLGTTSNPSNTSSRSSLFKYELTVSAWPSSSSSVSSCCLSAKKRIRSMTATNTSFMMLSVGIPESGTLLLSSLKRSPYFLPPRYCNIGLNLLHSEMMKDAYNLYIALSLNISVSMRIDVARIVRSCLCILTKSVNSFWKRYDLQPSWRTSSFFSDIAYTNSIHLANMAASPELSLVPSAASDASCSSRYRPSARTVFIREMMRA